MKLPESRSMWSIVVVIVATVIAQFPAVSAWIKQATNDNEHLVTIVEGIIAVLLLIFATYRGELIGGKR